jgi:hypothetical protein
MFGASSGCAFIGKGVGYCSTRLQRPRRDPIPLAWKDFGMDAHAPRGLLRWFADLDDPHTGHNVMLYCPTCLSADGR